jgi:predicted RNase H-like HicB family nuclease
MRDLSVLIREAEDLPGCWVAHCLDWDVVTQGDSPLAAAEAIVEALALVAEADLAEGVDPNERCSAPVENWAAFRLAARMAR